MIASLPMYARPENAGAHDRFWALIRENIPVGGREPPRHLTREGDPWDHWQAPDLFLSQTCGLPYRSRLHGRVTLLGTPDFGLTDMPPGHYNSVIVCRVTDARGDLAEFAGARLAVNDPLSQSGWAAPQAHAARLGLPAFGNIALTGSHRNSALAVVRDGADLAALDAITWRMMTRWDPFARHLRILDETCPGPALPYITALGMNAAEISAALRHAIEALSDADRADLGGLGGYAVFEPEDYLALPLAPPLP